MINGITTESFYLSWTAPAAEHHNGEIINYVVLVTEASNGETFNVTSQQTDTEIGLLKPFTVYTCVVAAQTIAGIGPYSTAVITQTDEARKLEPVANVIIALHLFCTYNIEP